MPTYIALANFTSRGARDVHDAPNRMRDAINHAQRFGITVKGAYVTMGAYDEVLVLEAPDDATIARAMFTLCEGGNVRTATMRAFSLEEFEQVLGTQ